MANPIVLNNDALGLFGTGNHKDSDALLQVALGELRSRLAVPGRRQSGGNFGGGGIRRSLLLKSVPSCWSPSDNLKDNCNGITFFDRTFVISTTCDGTNNNSEVENDYETDCKTCALILYNLGVTRHLEGIMTDQQEALESSYRFYGMALEFIQMQFKESVCKFDDSLLLLSMALMNNIAHIQSARFDYGETDHCIKWLRQAATQIETSLLQDPDHMFFFLRYYVVPTNQISTSAAA